MDKNLKKAIQYKDLELTTLLDLLTLFCKNYSELIANGQIYDDAFYRCRNKIEELQRLIREMMETQKHHDDGRMARA